MPYESYESSSSRASSLSRSKTNYVQIFAWFSGFGFFERVKCITQVRMRSSETKFLTETNNAVGDVTSAVLESRLKT